MATAAKKAPAKKAAPAKKTTPAKPKPSPMDYGYVKAFLDAHPDVAAKVRTAVSQGWTASRLQAEVKTTTWWKTRTDAQRQADLLSKENPTEWQNRINQKAAELHAQLADMGISLSDADINSMAKTFVTNGSSAGEQQAALGMKFSLAPGDQEVTGSAGKALDTINTLASQYGVPLDTDTAQKYVRQSLSQGVDPASYADHFREQAKVLYAPIADWLDANPGMSTRDYAAPYLQMAAKELGVPTDQMSLSDTKWTKFLSGANGAPMTTDEWARTYRTDPLYGWDKTTMAKSQASQMVMDLQRTFGMA